MEFSSVHYLPGTRSGRRGRRIPAKEIKMKSTAQLNGRKVIWIALAVTTACAAGSKSSKPDSVSGHWTGVIDRDGWQRTLSLDITNANGAYGGSWMSMESQPGVMLDRVDVDGDFIRFQLNSLAFAGRVSGRTLAGAVKDSVSGASSGQFTLMRIDPRPELVP